jgi:putative intracellular protease/amidase
MTEDRPGRGHILIVVTSNGRLGGTGRSTGLWMEELAAPYFLFTDAGFAVTIASPLGGAAPVDEGSLAGGSITPAVTRFRTDPSAAGRLAATVRLADVADMSRFDVIYLVGGHGTMWDFTPNADLGRLLDDADRREAIIAAVCHGAAGLLSPPAQGSLVKGRTLTGFSDEEEAALGLTEVVPFLLQTRLTAEGATVSAGPAFQPNVVAHGRLVTGQNPSSSQGVAEEILSLLRSRRKEHQ